MIEIECVLRGADGYGESPVWSPAEQALYWVDITAPAIRRYNPTGGTAEAWPLPEHVGSIALRGEGGLIAAMRSGIYGVNLARSDRELLCLLDSGDVRLRFNDGKCDRAGRFWVGTMDDRTFAPIGALYRLDAARLCEKLDEGFIIVNGIAWSPDDKTMYVADSRRELVYAYEFDIGTGAIANRRLFISTEKVEGRVDGATVAADGTYWCAHVRGWQVAQYDPKGNLMRAIRLPVKYPLMCTFGGRDMDTLYVTTSRAMVMAEEEEEGQPLAGSLFAIHGTGTRGLPEPPYAG